MYFPNNFNHAFNMENDFAILLCRKEWLTSEKLMSTTLSFMNIVGTL